MSLHSSKAQQASDSGEHPSVTPSSSKVKKKFSDLPTIYTLPDGKPAVPLEEWQGVYNTIPGHRQNNVNDVLILVKNTKNARKVRAENDNLTTSGSVMPDRRRRKSKVEKSEITALSIEDTQSDSVGPRPKRTRAKTSSVCGTSGTRSRRSFAEDDLTVNAKTTQPRNVLAKEILENLQKFPHCLLLTRVGQFYESYFEQAVEIAGLLNIKLTSRKWDGRRIPMCGFPIMHIDKYLKLLVQTNKRFVAMCEEFPRLSSSGVKEFNRRVVRIITPGTLIDEPFLNPYENNYLLAIYSPTPLSDNTGISVETEIGLAWIDVSTGEFFSKPSIIQNLQDELVRIGPREVVLDKHLQALPSHPVSLALAEEGNFTSYITLSYDCDIEAEDSENPVDEAAIPDSPQTSAFTDIEESVENVTNYKYTLQEQSAIDLLTTFLHANLLEHMPKLASPNREGVEKRMQIDSHTIKALEIREGIYEGGVRGSLLSVIKRTTTSGGTRLLARWISSPSTSMDEISFRQSLVALFYRRPHFRADLVESLKEAGDPSRIVQKLLLRRGDCSDLLTLNKNIGIWSNIKARIEQEIRQEGIERDDFDESEWSSAKILTSCLADLKVLSTRISDALDSDIISKEMQEVNGSENEQITEAGLPDSEVAWKNTYGKWIIRPQFSKRLNSLHTTLEKLIIRRDKLELTLQLKYDAPSLTLRTSPAQGMHIHLAKAKRDQKRIKDDSEFVMISESGTTKCYFYKKWSQLGSQITETVQALFLAEREAFEILRKEVTSFAILIQRNARILDELDVSLSFANLAMELNFIRPTLTEDTIYNVANGRHPAVEQGLLSTGRVFTPNSVNMTPSSRFHVITGPNMAGKSTFLRQTALIAILAQVGSFVPADSATIGIVDKLFSRIGAKDDLFRDRSTFMVEMLETADILHRATPKSLVIMDEVGRGTTVKDGLAIAFATIHHLLTSNRCRCLFATHFHELSDMLGFTEHSSGQGAFSDVRFYCTDVDETEDDHFAYSYRLKPGVNRDSHGLKVAQLAGLPMPALKVATKTLAWLKNQKSDFPSSLELTTYGQSFRETQSPGASFEIK